MNLIIEVSISEYSPENLLGCPIIILEIFSFSIKVCLGTETIFGTEVVLATDIALTTDTDAILSTEADFGADVDLEADEVLSIDVFLNTDVITFVTDVVLGSKELDLPVIVFIVGESKWSSLFSSANMSEK